MPGLAPASEDVHSLFCGAERIFTMFIHSDRVELLYYFVLNYRKPGDIYFLTEMAADLSVVWLSFVFVFLVSVSNICQNRH